MSLVRMFMTTCLQLVQAQKWDLLRDYMATVAKVLAANEAIIIPGTPTDKPIR